MIQLDLAIVQNQQFSATLDNDRYVIRIYQAGGIMCSDITRNEAVVHTGERIVGGDYLIPFFGQSGTHGNFMMLTQSEALPDYNQFGVTQTLVYMSVDEIAAAVGGTVP